MSHTLRSSIAMFLLSPAVLAAQGANTGVALRFGSLGVGVEMSHMVGDHMAIRVGANQFTLNKTQEQSDITFDAQLKLQGFSSIIDISPWHRGAFHISGGIITAPAKVTATGRPTGGTIDVNGTTYTEAQVGTLVADATFPSVNPYAGIGWGTPASKRGHVRLLLDLGAAFGKPTIAMHASNSAVNAALASDLAAQTAKTQGDVDKYAKVYPVVQLGLIVRF